MQTLAGSSLGIGVYTSRARGAETAGEASDWQSETSLRCMLGHGRGRGTRRLAVTTGQNPGSLSAVSASQ